MTSQPRPGRALERTEAIPITDGRDLPAALALPAEPGDVRPEEPAERRPKEPLSAVCPVVASYGGRDRVFGAHGARLSSALIALDVPHDVKTYADAGHSFMNQHDGPLGWVARRSPLHAGYHGPSAEDAWRRTFEFLGRHLAPDAPRRDT